MKTESADQEESVEVGDRDRIVEILHLLDDRRHALTVALHDASARQAMQPDYPAHLERFDAAKGVLTLSVTDAGSLETNGAGERTLTLRAENDRILRFERLEVFETRREGSRLSVRCGLPARLVTAARREQTRVRLREDMPVEAALTRFADQPPIRGRLCDISSGGCLLSLPLADCVALAEGLELPALTLVFPGGQRFTTAATLRHLNSWAHSAQATAGLSFDNPDRACVQQLSHIVADTEREIAWRTGEASLLATPTRLYHGRKKKPARPAAAPSSRRKPQGLDTLAEIASDQHAFLLALRNQRPLPLARLERSAERLIELHDQGRQAFFYALACLDHEPHWMQHSLNVAGRLADLMLAEPDHNIDTHRAVRAALIHDLGKAMLVDDGLPSLECQMTPAQREYVRTHVEVLLKALERADYATSEAERDVIGNINERLDGSGYPHGLTAEALSPVARMAAVIDVIDAMTRPRDDRPPLNAAQAYRFLYQRPESFDRHWVTRYIQRHGFYPLGSLVHFSRGYLAWVLALDERGQPLRVRVVRNLHRKRVGYDDEIGRADFDQLGRLTGSACPHHYGL